MSYGYDFGYWVLGTGYWDWDAGLCYVVIIVVVAVVEFNIRNSIFIIKKIPKLRYFIVGSLLPCALCLIPFNDRMRECYNT